MVVVTAHTNADFDTFASMIAVKLLYPEAHLVFSGSLERGLRECIEKFPPPYAFEKIKDIDLASIRRLILVDVRHASRIGAFEQALKNAGLDVHIYDHHPVSDADIRGSVEVILPYGSTTTILAHIIREKNVALSPQEATILMAGIYEDTGYLSYPSTTVKDFEAAAFLLASGADLTVVDGWLKKEMSPGEVTLLNELIQGETSYVINGAETVIAVGYLEKCSADISGFAHRMLDIQGISSIFILIDSRDRVHLVARSRDARVDAGRVCKTLGGGGHPQAASATIKNATLIEAKERLLAALREGIPPRQYASDIMSHPPITAASDASMQETAELLRRYGVNAAPVVKNAAVLGIITRQVADKAIHHGLKSSKTGDYMTVDFESVSADTSIDEIRASVIGHGARILPVFKEGRIVGVITRTDLLKLLQKEFIESAAPSGHKSRVVTKLMRETLPEHVLEIMKEAGRVADKLGMRAYAVGGFARDLLLRRANLDIDIVVEGGNGITFAAEMARSKGIKVKTHQRFKTAVIIYPDGFRLDVATARLEYYEKPGALPTIEQSSLKLDLYRRDFIINTLAIALNPDRFGEVLDFFGAQKDLKDRTIRVLHNLTFVEDPTRMLRAVRFSEKFGFKLARHTVNLIKNSVKIDIFRRLTGSRLLDEIKSILDEETAVKSIRLLHELGVLKLIHPSIRWDTEREAAFERAHETVVWHQLLYSGEEAEGWLTLLLTLTDTLKEAELFSLVKGLGLSGKKRIAVINSRREGLKALGRISTGLLKKESAVVELLDPLPLETVLYLMAKTEDETVKKTLSAYITRLKEAECELNGADLKKMGVKEGPLMGEILRTLNRKRIDREIFTRADEEAFVKRQLGKGKRRR